MTARPRRARPRLRVPVLAMVDAFVGGTAILLILIILASNRQETQGTEPQADLILRCTDGQIAAQPPPWAALPPPRAMAPAEAAEWAATHPRPDRLLLKVRLEADTQEYRCATRFQHAADEMNERTDNTTARDRAEPRAILAVSLVLTGTRAEPEPLP